MRTAPPNRAPESATYHLPVWSFSDRLRKIRTDAGYEQRTFAALLGLKAPTYSAYESGRVSPRYKDIGALAARVEDLTGVPAWWLLDLADTPDIPAPQPIGFRLTELDSRRESTADIFTQHNAPAPVRDAIVTAISERVRGPQ